MRELAQNVLDLAENSLRAGATEIKISITETEKLIALNVTDNGGGMDEEKLQKASDPFFSSKGSVGLGLAMLKDEALRTGGEFDISSSTGGTSVSALVRKDHIDALPLGNITATLLTLSCSRVRIIFSHKVNGGEITLDTNDFTDDIFQKYIAIKNNLHRQYLNS